MRTREPMNRGGAMMEFCLLVPVIVPLLVGTMWIGSTMVRGQQVTQMARDLASMYSRGSISRALAVRPQALFSPT